jgi:hypothetical protein
MTRERAAAALGMLVLAVAPAQAAPIVPSPLTAVYDWAGEVVEGTVLAARLLTYQQDGETRTCGAVYDMRVDDLVPGQAPRQQSFARVFSGDAAALQAPTRQNLAVGATYFLGVIRDAATRYEEVTPAIQAANLSADAAAQPAIRACLAQLPPDYAHMPLEIYTGHGVAEAFVRIPPYYFPTRADGVLGAFDNRLYGRTGSIDTKAHDYLVEGAKPARMLGGYLASDTAFGLSGHAYDTVLSYAALKRLFGIGAPP